jgi:ABC-type multidrug transport system fused ATPase/permease subunit
MYILKIISSFFKEYKITLIVYFIFTLLTFPLESIIVPQIYSHFFEILNEKTEVNVFIKYFFMILISLIIINGSIIYTEYIESYLIPELNKFIINYIFKNLIYKYENNITDIELGKVVSRLNIIPGAIKEFISNICTWILPRFLTIIVINIYFFYIDWRLGCISFILLLLFFCVSIRNFLKCNNSSYERHKLFEEKSQYSIDKLSNSFSIYSNSKVNKEINDYEENTNIYIKKFK